MKPLVLRTAVALSVVVLRHVWCQPTPATAALTPPETSVKPGINDGFRNPSGRRTVHGAI